MNKYNRRRDRTAAVLMASMLTPGDQLKTPKGFADAAAETARRAVVAADLLLRELDRPIEAPAAGDGP